MAVKRTSRRPTATLAWFYGVWRFSVISDFSAPPRHRRLACRDHVACGQVSIKVSILRRDLRPLKPRISMTSEGLRRGFDLLAVVLKKASTVARNLDPEKGVPLHPI